jgi:regulator of sigma E protease
MLTSIVAAVVILGLLIIVHEAGHFLMAKRLGVRVLRFSIGYPPKLFGFRRGETEYVIGATPVGGYVRMLGEEVGEEPRSDELGTYLAEMGHDLIEAARATGAIPLAGKDFHETLSNLVGRLDPGNTTETARIVGRALRPEETLYVNRLRTAASVETAIKSLQESPPEEILRAFRARAFPNQQLWKRFAIVLAGPASNLLFAPVLLAIVFMYGVPVALPIVGKTMPNSPAAQAGLMSGDRIVSVNGKATPTWSDFSDDVKSGKGGPITIEIERVGAQGRLSVRITPRREEQKTIFGTTASEWIIGVTPRGDTITRRFNPISAVIHAVTTTASLTAQLVVGIASIVSGAIPIREALGGPIMIAQVAGREAHQGFASVAMFTVMLSLELGLINLLPVPLLDGGHLAFFVFEGLRGKPLAIRHREIALQVGLFLLVALMAFVIFNDISRIVQG